MLAKDQMASQAEYTVTSSFSVFFNENEMNKKTDVNKNAQEVKQISFYSEEIFVVSEICLESGFMLFLKSITLSQKN